MPKYAELPAFREQNFITEADGDMFHREARVPAIHFALPVYEENALVRYNISHARLLINHAENGRKDLYDILAIKKETSKP